MMVRRNGGTSLMQCLTLTCSSCCVREIRLVVIASARNRASLRGSKSYKLFCGMRDMNSGQIRHGRRDFFGDVFRIPPKEGRELAQC
jgi:hypothetical protein